MNINIYLEGLLKYLANPFKRKKDKNNISDLIQTLSNHSKEEKIQIIIQRLINDINDVGLLYRVQNENQFNLINFFGYNKIKEIRNLNVSLIPIFIHSNLKYLLMICKKNKRKIKVNMDIINLLKDILD